MTKYIILLLCLFEVQYIYAATAVLDDQTITDATNIDKNKEGFGASVSLFQNQLVVGVPNKINNLIPTGSAQIFEKTNSGWSKVADFFAADKNANDLFGTHISIQNDSLLVSAPKAVNPNDDNTGAVYYFKKNNGSWQEAQKILPSDGAQNDNFGESFCLINNSLIVNSRINNSSLQSKIYIFEFNGVDWIGNHTFLSNTINSDYGQSISCHSNSFVVGSPSENKVLTYTQNNSNWILSQELTIPIGNFGSKFGFEFTVDDTSLIILTQRTESSFGFTTLYIYFHVFEKTLDNWEYSYTYENAINTDALHPFNFQLKIKNNLLVFTSHIFTGGFVFSANTFFYNKSANSLQLIRVVRDGFLQATDTRMSIALNEDYAFIGNTSESFEFPDIGAIKVFNINPPDEIFMNGFE